MKGQSWKLILVTFSILFSLYLLVPTTLKFATGKQVSRVSKAEDPWYYSILPAESLKLGLDLMGGLHLVLGIDFNEVNRDAVVKLKNQLKDLLEMEKVSGVELSTTNDNYILVKYPNDDTWKKVDKIIGKDLGQSIDFEGQSNDTARLKMTALYEADVRRRAVDQSMETLRNRIDEFGIAEPIIQRQGEERIMVQFPGVQDPGRLKDIISRTAKLSFQIEQAGPEEPNGTFSESKLQEMVATFQKEKNMKPDEKGKPFSLFLSELNKWAQGKIPEGTEILFHKKVNINTKEATYTPYLLSREALVTGEDLQDAYYSFDPQTNEPIVNFQLTPVGATKFEKATGENVGRYMAIVLDSNVHSAPRIKTKIGGGRAMIEMGSSGRSQQEILNDAKDTSLVLRSGALPARLEFLEERVVGPSLGADAIREGSRSLLLGVALVFGLLLLYYRASGGVAVAALVINLLMILAAMAAFEGTLTLPGLAGLTLSLAMAVDANVLIFEHTRDELRKGRSFKIAMQEGYNQAFGAIFDANVTILIASLVLLGFGYGPIRGFAVTMLIGNVVSLYTNVFMTRVFFEYLVFSKNRESFSI